MVMKARNRNTWLILLNTLSIAELSLQNNLIQQPSTELVVSLIVNNEEHLLRALADTVAISSIILEAYTSAPFIKTHDSNTTIWSTTDSKFTTNKTGMCL
jgi:hypothetical protein